MHYSIKLRHITSVSDHDEPDLIDIRFDVDELIDDLYQIENIQYLLRFIKSPSLDRYLNICYSHAFHDNDIVNSVYDRIVDFGGISIYSSHVIVNKNINFKDILWDSGISSKKFRDFISQLNKDFNEEGELFVLWKCWSRIKF